MPIIKEKSCGVLIFRVDEKNERQFLLLHYPGGHWDFPKGHVEENENEFETAQRETVEETGIQDLQFLDEFREPVEYFYQRDGKLFHKEVVFFIAETKTEQVTLSHEHQGYEWLSFHDTLARLTFENTKKILKKAQLFFESHVQ